ncbi:MAG TPA: biotin carboxylase N-terminal domain-containing protein [Solirubrobacterales bacterium]
MDTSVLVANRGEIALRVMRTLRRLGIRSIAVYSDADAGAPHVRAADTAVRLGPAPAAESYLSAERVLAAAKESGATAIHPGYGFLSEDADFAAACEAAGLTFIGPRPAATRLLGDKVAAKLLAAEHGVPVLPGLQKPGLTDEEITAFVAEGTARLPLMIKAAAGGGGRGMRVVRDAAALADGLAAARREALAGFGDDSLLVERYVERARHVEVQILADSHGNVVHLGERECSLQRRHQKVVEESPSPVVTPAIREPLCAAAVELARAAGYVGAGTAEFLVSADDPTEWFFLEVNARLQVEHPVTELVTGLDLVEQQLLVAAGAPLSFTQDEVTFDGHAIEVRVCAEDPAADFLPAVGELVAYREPEGAGIRVDSGVEAGTQVTPFYDSLLLKVIAYGADRAAAVERLDLALGQLRLLGLPTNAGYLRRLVNLDRVRAGDIDTGLIDRGEADVLPPESESRAALAAFAASQNRDLRAGTDDDPWDALVGFRLDGPAPLKLEIAPRGGDPVAVSVAGAPGSETVTIGAPGPDGDRAAADGDATGDGETVSPGPAWAWEIAASGDETWLAAGPEAFAFHVVRPVVEGNATAAQGTLEAPMPGTVLELRVVPGEAVVEGQVLVVIESMKMEMSLTAPVETTVIDVLVAAGDGVKQGQSLVELEPVG